MTVRQRQGTGSATATIATGSDAGVERSALFSWETWFRHASSQQRMEALGLAQAQGVVYPHQLPAVTNGVKPAIAPLCETPASAMLDRLFTGSAGGMPQFDLAAPSFFDAGLDELQRQAVVRALGTPDVFMLQGLPGTGKSRTVAEIVRQSTARGLRVLYLATHAASLDVVLHRLADRPEVLAVRFLDTHEKAESLPAWLRGLTLDQQQKAFLERTQQGAQVKHSEADAACRRRREVESLWSELQACLGRCDDIRRRMLSLDTQDATLDDTLEQEAAVGDSPIATLVTALGQERDRAIQALTATLRTHQEALASCDQELIELAAKIAVNEPAFRAKKQNRFWTAAFWANLFNGTIVQETEAILEQHSRAQVRRQTIVQQIDESAGELKKVSEQFTAERAAMIRSEIASRRQALVEQRRILEDEQRQLGEHWDALGNRLGVATIDKTRIALDGAHQCWLTGKKNDEQSCLFAQEWMNHVVASGPHLSARLPSFANVLAGTIRRWQADASFREAAGAPFDLVILEDADSLTDVDLLRLSRLGQRCILISQLLVESTSAAEAWSRAWQGLGGDAGRWPCVWSREDGRLVCQLMPLTAEDRRFLDCEELADSPDIELCILQRPQTSPCLAQVVFGPECSFADAFTFMVHEVQEFPLQPIGSTAWWSEDAQRHIRRLGQNSRQVHTRVEIEPGVRLGTVLVESGDPVLAVELEFDKSAGWDRARAEAWLQRRRPAADHLRAVFLQTQYRFSPALVSLVQAVVRPSDWIVAGDAAASVANASVHFEAVPPLTSRGWPCDGASQELDLAAGRNGDRLPVGLRHGLPSRGYLNYPEAQALIKKLEGWASGAAVLPTYRVGVLGLYEGQVELLRRLVEQSEILRARRFAMEVALPSRVHQGEFDVVFLSLTRSPSQRAVAFGEDVKELPIALTRARSCLFLFADPGSLARRAAWHGPLDQLDAQTGEQELRHVSRLLAYWQESQVPHRANGVDNGKH